MPRNRRSPKEWQYPAACHIVAAPFYILAAGVIMADNISGFCTGVLAWPIIAITLFFLTIIGLTLFFCDSEDSVLVSALAYVLFLLAILALMVFGYVAVGGFGSRVDAGEVREYDLKDYSGWLRGRTAEQQYWDTLSACLRRKHACKRMTTRPLVRDPKTGIFVPEASREERRARKNDPDRAPSIVTPIESGCCKPLSSCGFTYVNGTTWTQAPTPAPSAPAVETNVDCSRWSNDQQKLCFQCDSCKAGLLADISGAWFIAGLLLISTLLMTICLFCALVCCS